MLGCGADGSKGSSFLTESLTALSRATGVIDLGKDRTPLNISEARLDKPKHQKNGIPRDETCVGNVGNVHLGGMGEPGPAV